MQQDNKQSSVQAQDLQTSRRHFSQFALKIMFLVILSISSAGFFVLGKNSNEQPQQQISQSPSPVIVITQTTNLHTLYPLGVQSVTPTETPAISQEPLQKIIVSSWQRYKDHYSEISLDYPVGWTSNECPGEGSGLGCIQFYPTTSDQNQFANLITLGVYGNYFPVSQDQSLTLLQDNFPIPALSPNEKAALYQSSDGTILITFTHNTVKYFFTISNEYVHTHNLDISSIEAIMKHMAQSVTFINEPYSCKDPSLTSLTMFPENFTLLNGHESDGTDQLNAMEPFSRLISDTTSITRNTEIGTYRIFMVNYVKSGTTFENPSFANVVSAIQGKTSISNSQETTTEITHINCVDTQDDGPGTPQVYYPSLDDTDPFAIHMYGYKDNPINLWSVLKWNESLLKKTRNEVYIRKGNQWQKYTATGYFVSLVEGYGGKPAIYLYPEKQSRISVAIHPAGSLIKTDDLYNPSLYGWSVIAEHNGIIENKYPYLYYEALFPFERPGNGYVIPYKNLFSFVHTYVEELGLNKNESNAFTSYWQAILQPSPYYYISHLDQGTINRIYPLSISPKPDALLRVEIYFEPLTQQISINPPVLESPIMRRGFTAVEWGAIYNK